MGNLLCQLTNVKHVTKYGESDGSIEWCIYIRPELILNKDYISSIPDITNPLHPLYYINLDLNLSDSNLPLKYRIYQIDNNSNILIEDIIDVANINIYNFNKFKIPINNLKVGLYGIQIYQENKNKFDTNNILHDYIIYSSSIQINQPDKLHFIINNSTHSCSLLSSKLCNNKYSIDIDIIGGIAPYNIYLNNKLIKYQNDGIATVCYYPLQKIQ